MREVTDHKGKVYESLESMCREYKIGSHTYRARIKAGATVEEALTFDRYSSLTEDHRTITSKCKEWGYDTSTYYRRKRLGIGLEKREEVVDHLGNTYRSEVDMTRAYGVDRNTYRYRRYVKNWSLEESLKGINRDTVDHKGNSFNTIKEMCESYGITYVLYKNRLNSGWTLEEALICKPGERKKRKKENEI
jgi:hypothetical protein